jgi:hypothetical protein
MNDIDINFVGFFTYNPLGYKTYLENTFFSK